MVTLFPGDTRLSALPQIVDAALRAYAYLNANNAVQLAQLW